LVQALVEQQLELVLLVEPAEQASVQEWLVFESVH
jgi:hypothetical protein